MALVSIARRQVHIDIYVYNFYQESRMICFVAASCKHVTSSTIDLKMKEHVDSYCSGGLYCM